MYALREDRIEVFWLQGVAGEGNRSKRGMKVLRQALLISAGLEERTSRLGVTVAKLAAFTDTSAVSKEHGAWRYALALHKAVLTA
jgi:hypothetical protein